MGALVGSRGPELQEGGSTAIRGWTVMWGLQEGLVVQGSLGLCAAG